MSTVAEVKAKTGKMRSHEYAAWASNPANREEVALLDAADGGSTSGFKRIDLGGGVQTTERTAVVRPCVTCGKDAVVASDFQGNVFCSDECIQLATNEDQRARGVLQAFANAESRFYRCAYNTQRLVDYFQANPEKKWVLENVKRVFENLYAEGKMLPTISLADITKMSPDEYNTRLRLDPDLGGHRKAIDEKQALTSGNQRREVESAQPSIEPSPKIQAMRAAANQELHRKAAGYANRGTIVQYRNGVPVEVPATSQNIIYRNGRRMN